MTKSKKPQKPKHKPLEPHVEYGEYGKAVVVVRVPQDTHPVDKTAAIKKMKELAKQHSHTGWDI